MKLEFGAGNADAVLDLAKCKVEMYNEAGLESNPFHVRFGGRQYYTSHSGLSGAGWIADRPDLRPVAVLRTDVSRPKVPSVTETLPGFRVVVMTKHLQRERFPLLVVRDREVLVLFDELELEDVFLGKHEFESVQEFELTSWTETHSGQMSERNLTIAVRYDGKLTRHWGKLSLRRVLELLFWNDLFQKGAATVYADKEEPFYGDLGLHRAADGRLYRSTGGILRYPVEETIEALEAETGLKFYDVGGCFAHIVEEDGVFRVRHQAERGNAHYGFENLPIDLTLSEAIDTFSNGELSSECTEAVRVMYMALPPVLPEGHVLWECEILGCHSGQA